MAKPSGKYEQNIVAIVAWAVFIAIVAMVLLWFFLKRSQKNPPHHPVQSSSVHFEQLRLI